LILDGDVSVGMLIEHVLSNHGYQVTLIGDGLKAKEFIHGRVPPDLVLLDLAVPFVSGHDLLELIRQSGGGWERVPVVLMSMRTNEQDIVRGLEAGAEDFVTKPFRIDELVARIRRIVKSGSQTRLLPAVDANNTGAGHRKPRRLLADNPLRLSA
jgi:DNA-binding response OmpR family regulator